MIDLVLFPNQSVKLHIQIRTYTGLISVLCINAHDTDCLSSREMFSLAGRAQTAKDQPADLYGNKKEMCM